jgi:hypothetical protein
MDSIDVSNNTTRFTAATVREWVAQGIGLVQIQLIGGVRLAGDDCGTQISTCLEGGVAVDCYLFPGNDGLSLSTAQRLALVPPEARVKIRQLWVDVEKAYSGFATQGQVSKCHADCDAWAPWQQTGDYTALWVAQGVGWLPWPWPNRKQWLVNVFNDGHPNLGGAFSGTNNHVMTQYHEDVVLAGVSGIDRSLLSDAEALEVTKWLGGPMAITVGDGMKAQMTAAGDAPLCDHVNYDQTDDAGAVFQVEKCLGSKGLYVSSNESTQWVNAGPI